MIVVAALGTTQTLAWASSYYLPAILAVPIARDRYNRLSLEFSRKRILSVFRENKLFVNKLIKKKYFLRILQV